MNGHLDQLIAQSIAHDRERELQSALRQRRGDTVGSQRGRHVAVAWQHSLRARLAHLWALSH